LGGTGQEGNWNTDVDSQDKNRIWEGCVRLVPSLRVSISMSWSTKGTSRVETAYPSGAPEFTPGF